MNDGTEIKAGDDVRPDDDLWAELEALGPGVRRVEHVDEVRDKRVGMDPGDVERQIHLEGRGWIRARGWEVVAGG